MIAITEGVGVSEHTDAPIGKSMFYSPLQPRSREDFLAEPQT
ncbi:MAG: hypothetical protein AAGG51_04960 [Cyanobacteria bacterium P01_G01_bin.54]